MYVLDTAKAGLSKSLNTHMITIQICNIFYTYLAIPAYWMRYFSGNE